MVLDIVRDGESPIQFLSDVPMEWAQVDGWPISLTRPVSRLPIGAAPWDVVAAAAEIGAAVDATVPERVLVLDLVKRHDPIRRYSDYFESASNAGGQRYTYATPDRAEQFRKIAEEVAPDIVVLDSHGRYSPLADQLWIDLPNRHERSELRCGGGDRS